MTTWERKGFAAGKSGRFRDMYSGWNAAKGKPKLSARDRKLGVTFNGKMVDAQEYFYSGFLEGERNRPNPSWRKTKKKIKAQLRKEGRPLSRSKVLQHYGEFITTRPRKNPGNIYYRIMDGGQTFHHSTKAAARKHAQRIANRTGGRVELEKMSHQRYHRTGNASMGVVANIFPKGKVNPAGSIIRARKIEIVRNARGQAVKLRIHRA